MSECKSGDMWCDSSMLKFAQNFILQAVNTGSSFSYAPILGLTLPQEKGSKKYIMLQSPSLVVITCYVWYEGVFGSKGWEDSGSHQYPTFRGGPVH